MGLVKRENGVKILRKIHEKIIHKLEKKISKEERMEMIDRDEDLELSGKTKLPTSDILRILSEKECIMCGAIISPPRLYCEKCKKEKCGPKRQRTKKFYHGLRDVL